MKLASKSFGIMQNGNINKKIMMLIIKNSFQFYHSKIYTLFFSLMQLVTILPFEGIIICVWMWQHRIPFRDFVQVYADEIRATNECLSIFHVTLSNQKLHIVRDKMLDALAQSIKIIYVFTNMRHRNEVFVLYVYIMLGMNLEVLIRETRDEYHNNSRSVITSTTLNLR